MSSSVRGVQVETTMGVFVVELYVQDAPKTCKNFSELAARGYYDGTIFHRVIRDFMIQVGMIVELHFCSMHKYCNTVPHTCQTPMLPHLRNLAAQSGTLTYTFLHWILGFDLPLNRRRVATQQAQAAVVNPFTVPSSPTKSRSS